METSPWRKQHLPPNRTPAGRGTGEAPPRRIRQLHPCIGGRMKLEGTWAPCESRLWEAHRGHVDPLPSKRTLRFCPGKRDTISSLQGPPEVREDQKESLPTALPCLSLCSPGTLCLNPTTYHLLIHPHPNLLFIHPLIDGGGHLTHADTHPVPPRSCSPTHLSAGPAQPPSTHHPPTTRHAPTQESTDLPT